MATASLLQHNPQLSFRVNAFRNRVSLDYIPTISSVLQLVRLLQAEFESASLSVEGGAPDKKARAAALQFPGIPEKPKAPPSKNGNVVTGDPQARALEPTSEPKGKGKGKDKGSNVPQLLRWRWLQVWRFV